MMRRASHGFSLIELLVVVAIVSLLMGLLLPAMSGARESARKAGCLTRLGQIMRASTMYQDDHDDYFPIRHPEQSGFYSNYNHGGRYPMWDSRSNRHFTLPPFDRPLNSYAHPNAPLGGKPNVFGQTIPWRQRLDPGVTQWDLEDPDQFNLRVFECPDDRNYNYQEGLGELFDGNSAYGAIGTSYMFNCTWFNILSNHPRATTWKIGRMMFRRGRMVYPSLFVGFHDDPADATFWQYRSPKRTHHGKPDVNAMAFLDGHAQMVLTLYEDNEPLFTTSTYFLIFPELLN